MAVGNGKDADDTTLIQAIEEHGGVWCGGANGAGVIQRQIAQMRAAREARAQLLQLEAQRQSAIRALQIEADQAQADFVACMKSSDYEGVAKAARRMSRAECALVNLGAYER